MQPQKCALRTEDLPSSLQRETESMVSVFKRGLALGTGSRLLAQFEGEWREGIVVMRWLPAMGGHSPWTTCVTLHGRIFPLFSGSNSLLYSWDAAQALEWNITSQPLVFATCEHVS